MYHLIVPGYAWWFALVPCIMIAAVLRWRGAVSSAYRYSLADQLAQQRFATNHIHLFLFFVMRIVALVLIAFLIGRPQRANVSSKIMIDGIDIMLVLDVSGSMENAAGEGDTRTRFEVAKEEAIRFVSKREHDALGLVIFAGDVVSRCPLTHDKQVVTRMIEELTLGEIDAHHTKLALGMVAAANRLKYSKAKSKIMILLTDGEPSDQDINLKTAITVAQKLKIKVYTVGIGSDRELYEFNPVYGAILRPRLNTALLNKIAQETGGQSFLASSARDMRTIYDTIDSLEKTEHETPLFSSYYHLYVPFVLAILALFTVEIFLSAFVWFSV